MPDAKHAGRLVWARHDGGGVWAGVVDGYVVEVVDRVVGEGALVASGALAGGGGGGVAVGAAAVEMVVVVV